MSYSIQKKFDGGRVYGIAWGMTLAEANRKCLEMRRQGIVCWVEME